MQFPHLFLGKSDEVEPIARMMSAGITVWEMATEPTATFQSQGNANGNHAPLSDSGK